MADRRGAPRLVAWIYARALALYPAPFRSAYAPEMGAVFRSRASQAWRTKGLAGRAWFLIRELGGVVRGAAIQRARARRTDRSKGHHGTGGDVMGQWSEEVRQAIRRLVKKPAFTLATVVTLALGIGANTAIFSIVHSVVLSPLPFDEPEELVWIDHPGPGLGPDVKLQMTAGLYRLYSLRSHTLSDVAIWRDVEVTLTGAGDPERIFVTRATHTLGTTLRVPPLHGRWLDAQDDLSGGGGVAVLGYAIWQSRFGGDPEVVGQTIRLNDFPMEIVGIMPEGFTFPNEVMPSVQPTAAPAQMWIPEVIDLRTASFGSFTYQGVARLAPGVTSAEAQRELDGLLTTLPDFFPDQVSGMRQILDEVRMASLVVPLKEQVVGDVRQTLWLLLGTVGFVLLIACANVGNLFLVRAESREREVAVRTAIGASRAQLVRFHLTESVLLTVAGAAVGIVLARSGVRTLVAFGPPTLPRLDAVSVQAPALVFTGVVAVFASLLFAAIPMLGGRRALVDSLRAGARGSTSGRPGLETRHVLVVSQVALALVLLVGSGLMLRTYRSLSRIDPGFSGREDVLTFQTGLPSIGYPTRADAAAFYAELTERLAALPGVEAVGTVSCLPLRGWCGGNPLEVEGRALEDGAVPPVIAMRRAGYGYFETVGIPLLRGRLLERADTENRTGAVVISSELADVYFPDEDPIGQRVHPGNVPADDAWYTVVGVVGNTPTRQLTDVEDPLIYMAMLGPDDTGISSHTMDVVLRSRNARALAGAVRDVVWEMNPSLALARVRTLADLLGEAGARTAFTMVVLLVSSAVALLLGAIGTYAVVAYVVNRRRGEIGIRMALGASSGDVHRMVLRQGGALAVTGVGIGLLGAWGLTRLMESLLYQVSPTDPTTYAGVSAVLLAVVVLATTLPARRAAAVDPTRALRSE